METGWLQNVSRWAHPAREDAALDDVRARRPGRWSRARDGLVAVAEYVAEALYGFLRPQWRRSGATMQEEAERLPGDEVIVQPNWQATRAITVHRPPAQVWPWLAQAGYGRGGWYGDLTWWKDPAGHKGVRSTVRRLKS